MKNKTRTFAVIMALGVAVFSLCALGCDSIVCISAMIASVALCFVYSFFVCKKILIKSLIAAFMAAIFAFCCFLWGLRLSERMSFVEDFANIGECRIVGSVDDVVFTSSYSSRYVVSVNEVDGENVNFKALLDMPFSSELCENQCFVSSGTFEMLDDKSEMYYDDAVYIRFEASDLIEGELTKASFYDKIKAFGDMLAEKLKNIIRGNEGGLAAALTLGRRTWLSSSINLDFRRIGASHILAVSGMHLSVLVLALERALHFVGKKKRSLILILVSLFFMMLTGMSPSVCRSAIMMSIYYFAGIVGRESDSVISLLISMTMILLFSPSAVFSTGFWMSSLATLGIVTVTPAFEFKHLTVSFDDCAIKKLLKKALRSVVSLGIVNISAQMFTLPVVGVCYGGISIVSFLSGFIMIPLAEASLVLSMLLCIFMGVPIIGALLACPTRLMLSLVIKVSSFLGDIDGIYISISQTYAVITIALCSLICLVILFSKRADRRWTFAAVAVMIFSLIIGNNIYKSITKDDVNIIYSAENKNESIVVSDGETCIAFDMSSGAYSSLMTAVENASELYHEELDMLVLTHLHVNHISSVKRITDNVHIRSLLLPTAENENDALVIRSITSLVGDDVDVKFYNRSSVSSIEVGDISVHLPEYVMLKRSSHPVIALTIAVRGHTLAYSGSALHEIDDIDEIYLNCNCTIIGSHGPVRHKFVDTSELLSDNVIIGSLDDDMIKPRVSDYILNDECSSVRIKFE